MIAVEGVVAAGEVQIAARIARVEQVVDAVVEASIGEGGPLGAALRRVVEHHVQDHLDAGGVQRLDHLLEVAHLAAGLGSRAVAALGGEQADRVVGPVVDQRLTRRRTGGVLVGLGHRQQLDRGHAQIAQMGDALDDAAEGARMVHPGRGVHREAAHMRFVDHGPRKRVTRRRVGAPIERVVHHQAARTGSGQVQGPQTRRQRAGERLGVRIEQRGGRIEAMTRGRIMGTVNPVQVGVARAHPVRDDVPDVSRTVQGNLSAGPPALRVVVQQQCHGRGVTAEQGELGSAVEDGRAQWLRLAAAGRERRGRAVHRIQWLPPAGAGTPGGGRQEVDGMPWQ